MANAGGKGGQGGSALSEAEVKYLSDRVAFVEKSSQRNRKATDAFDSQTTAQTTAASFGQTAKKFEASVRNAAKKMSDSASRMYEGIIVLLLLFILHQVI